VANTPFALGGKLLDIYVQVGSPDAAGFLFPFIATCIALSDDLGAPD
jgi:hypothetical protein